MINFYESKFILIYCLLLFFILGSVFGSFLNCVAYRIYHHLPWWRGRSVCDNCGHKLGLLDLFPVFSYLFLGGKCRYCHKKVGINYFLSELILGLVFVFYLLVHGTLDFILIRDLGLICILYGLSLCDLNNYEIPDTYIIIGIVWWLLFFVCDYSFESLANSLLGAFILGGTLLLLSILMDKILKKESLGGGDIKLFFMVGLYLGLILNFFNLILACFIGIIFVIVRKSSMIPFGPSIALSTFICLLYGSKIVSWYLSLLGLGGNL